MVKVHISKKINEKKSIYALNSLWYCDHFDTSAKLPKRDMEFRGKTCFCRVIVTSCVQLQNNFYSNAKLYLKQQIVYLRILSTMCIFTMCSVSG